MSINIESCTLRKADLIQHGIFQKSVLPGEVDGVYTIFFEFHDGMSRKFFPDNNRLSVFLFSKGDGCVKLNDREFLFDEVALFVPGIKDEIQITSGTEGLEFFQIILELTSDDQLYLKKQQNQLPYFITYSDCKQYSEAIKSEKTVNRTLLPDDIVPRLCLGSVETAGPDKVELHSHPMLEQYFFGLANNNCLVTADNARTIFKENDLLHIPLGSEHGVTVDEGSVLHYIWIDIFRNREDMSYIKDHHHEMND